MKGTGAVTVTPTLDADGINAPDLLYETDRVLAYMNNNQAQEALERMQLQEKLGCMVPHDSGGYHDADGYPILSQVFLKQSK